LDTEENVRVGVWHFVPRELKFNPEIDSQRPFNQHFNEYLEKEKNQPVFIYVHGIIGNR